MKLQTTLASASTVQVTLSRSVTTTIPQGPFSDPAGPGSPRFVPVTGVESGGSLEGDNVDPQTGYQEEHFLRDDCIIASAGPCPLARLWLLLRGHVQPTV
jgi:hypothetical protein